MLSSHGEIRSFGDEKYKVVGTRPIRHDGTDKVTGRAVYGGDTRLPGMLYGQVLRSPHAPGPPAQGVVAGRGRGGVVEYSTPPVTY